MPKMTVGELREALDVYEDHIQVVLCVGQEAEEFTVEPATDSGNMVCVVLESD